MVNASVTWMVKITGNIYFLDQIQGTYIFRMKSVIGLRVVCKICQGKKTLRG